MTKKPVYIQAMDTEAWKKLRHIALEEGKTMAEKIKEMIEKETVKCEKQGQQP